MSNIEALKELLRIPSVSTVHQGIEECAEKVKVLLEEAGFSAQIIQTEGHPVVFGEKKGLTDKTLLFYNHYDVQPPEPLDQWVSPPFEPEIRDNRLYARGVVDNKGNFMARLEAIKSFEELPITIKFVVEGEEEIGSPSLKGFVEKHGNILKADGCIWETGEKDEEGRPTMFLGTKGLLYVELKTTGANTDLHSGNAVLVENPAWKLVRALTTLKDSEEQILIEGFYDDIRQPEKEELDLADQIPFDGDSAKKSLEIDRFLLDMSDREAVSKILYGPTCNICGISAGYQGEGMKTVLPCKAAAKVDFRLVPDQNPEKIFELLKSHLKKHGFDDIDVSLLGTFWPAKTSFKEKMVTLVKESMDAVYEKSTVIYPSLAGSGPLWLFSHNLKIPTVSTGIGDEESNIHSPNESMSLTDYQEGVEVIKELIERF